MDRVSLAVSAFLRRHGIARTERLLVALSGGADSTALLLSLLALGQHAGAAHVHHGLRGREADGDADFAAALCRELGVPFHLGRVDAGAAAVGSPEERARRLRYAALGEIRERAGYARVATAHTQDDQAETVLLRAIRGTGAAGLRGIAPLSRDGRVVRPLLAVTRTELRAALARRGQPFREDSTNADARVPRNRLRREVLPVLEAVHPGAARKLAELAGRAGELAAWLDRSVEGALRGAHEADGGLWFDLASVRALPGPARAHALAALLRRAGLETRVSAPHLRRAEAFLEEAAAGRRLSLPAGSCLFRDRDAAWLGPAPGPRFPAPLHVALVPPAGLELPQRDVRLLWRREGEVETEGVPIPRSLERTVVVRSPRAGDRMQLDGDRRERPLKDLFTSARWSLRRRERALVVEAGGAVAGVLGLARARRKASLPHDWRLVAEPRGRC